MIAQEEKLTPPCLQEAKARRAGVHNWSACMARARQILAGTSYPRLKLPLAMVAVAMASRHAEPLAQDILPWVPKSYGGFPIKTKPKPFLSRLPASQ